MASSRGAEEAQVETGTADVSQQSRSTVTNTTTAGAQQSSSTQVEMTDLPSQQQRLDDHNPAETAAAHHDTTTTDPPQSTSHNSVPLTRSQTEALGPSTEGPIPLPPSNPNRGPTLSISLMLTTGARHPYKIDSKYLRARNVALGNTNKKSGGSVKEGKGKEDGNVDPREVLSGYKLKELIWTDWRSEWEARPASPSFIRLIIMGRMLDDKAALKGQFCFFPCPFLTCDYDGMGVNGVLDAFCVWDVWCLVRLSASFLLANVLPICV